MGLMDFFTPEAGQDRRRWLDSQEAALAEALRYYLGPTGIPERLGVANEMLNPVVGLQRSAAATNRALDPSLGGVDRVAAGADAATEALGALLGVSGLRAATEAAAPAVRGLLDDIVERANQPGAMPTTYSNPIPGLRLYHGSPHDFDRFDMSKIGTGEGAQAYGHGLYFAENPKVAQEYKNLMPMSDPTDGGLFYARGALAESKFNTSKAIDYLLGKRKETEAASGFLVDGGASTLAYIDDAIARIKAGEFKPGRMYEVQIDANPDDFIDYDQPWDMQPENVRRYFDYLTRGSRGYKPDGAELAGRMESNLWIKEAADAGIPGIRYLDAGSRGAGDGSRNYVVFDDQLISIIRKYGIAGAAVMLGVSAFDVEQAMAQGQQQPQGLLSTGVR